MFPNHAKATHLSGGEIFVENIGGDTFQVTMKLYGDCGGNEFLLDNNKSITITSSCTPTQTLNMILQNSGGTEVSQLCPAQITNSTCNSGTLPGNLAFEYTNTVVLSTQCADYRFRFQEANRNTTVNVTNSISLAYYVDATLNTTAFPNNKTPFFTADPLPYVCLGQNVSYNIGAVETQGDSVAFVLDTAYTTSGFGCNITNPCDVNYAFGYSALSPIPGMTINAFTGELNFTPATTGNFIVVIKAVEYNGVGQIISEVQRDIQFVVNNCTNQTPQAPSGGFGNFTGNADSVGVNQIDISPGENFCLDVIFEDTVNTTDFLSLSSNVSQVLPGSPTVSLTNGNPATATICWTAPTGINLSPVYTFIVSANDSACPVSATNSMAIQINVEQPDTLASVLTKTDQSCSGVCDGTAVLNVTGGVGPYFYQWLPLAAIPNGQGTDSVFNLCPGSYTVVITDLGDPDPSTNTVFENFFIDPATLLSTVNKSVTNDDCNTACSGAMSLLGVGGTGTISYNWNDGNTSSSRLNICAGNYTVTVSDANGCTVVEDFVVVEPAKPTAAITAQTDVSCFGGSDGSATLDAFTNCGFSTTYCTSSTDYDIGTATNAGDLFTYPAVIGGQNQSVRHQIILRASEIQASGFLKGKIDSLEFYIINNFGRSNLQNFQISMGCTSDTVLDTTTGWITGLTPVFGPSTIGLSTGTINGYQALQLANPYVWDGSSNVVIDICYNNSIGFNPTVNASMRYTNTSYNSVMYGFSDGGSVCGTDTIQGMSTQRPNIRLVGCDLGYTYAWPGGLTGPTQNSLAAGTYSVTISNDDGCSDTINVDIDEPTPLIGSISETQGIACNGDCNGELAASATGGTAPYSYDWSGGLGAGAIKSGLCAGTYTVTVTDANLCDTTVTFTISEPPVLTVSIAESQVISCFNVCDGELTASGSGGTAPYLYAWSNGGNGAVQAGLCDGQYIVTITDANLCTSTDTFDLTEPTLLVGAVTQTAQILCAGQCTAAATASASGGTPGYSYSWSNGNSGPVQNGLCAGSYTITVTDNRGCTDVVTLNVLEPNPIVVNVNVTNQPLCFGDCTGAATVSASGGTGSLTITWPNGSSIPTQTNLCAGTYVVTVTDGNNCQETGQVIIVEPALLEVSIAETQSISCNGVCDGELTATVTGGTPNYTVVWSNGGSGNSINGLCDGQYSVLVTDANGCTATDTFNLAEPTLLTASNTVNSQVSCFGVCDGNASISGSGGTSPYTFSWSDGGTGASRNDLCDGNYTVTVTDANLCTATTNLTITEPSEIILTLTKINDPLCAGTCDGAASASATGGSSPYTFNWLTHGTGPNQTNLCDGTYTVVVTDANGCDDTATINMIEPTALALTITETQSISCFGVCDGELTIGISGGTGPYTQLWSDFSTNLINDVLCAGSYSVTVTDANGCEDSISYNLTEPSTIQITPSVTDATCGASNGAIDIAPISGGTGPYTVSWNTSATGTSISGVPAGTYTATVTDANSCAQAFPISINDVGGPTAATDVTTDASCFGVCDGTSIVSPVGGTSPYTYSWSTGNPNDTLASVTGLCAAGSPFFVTVTDDNGCTFVHSVTVSEPGQIFVNGTVNSDPTCFGVCDGSATVSATGGTSPYVITWPGGATGGTQNSLCDGSYMVTVTDANGCEDSTSVTVTEPTPIVPLITETQSISCFGVCDGELTASATGGTAPYTFAWSNGATGPIQGTLCAGTYGVTVTDVNGCEDSTDFVLNEPSSIQITPVVTDANCGASDGAIGIAPISGGTGPYIVLWNTSATGTNISGIPAGTYTATVTDANSCSQAFPIIVNDIGGPTDGGLVGTEPSCNGLCDGSIASTPTGGNAPYNFTWSTGGTANSISNLCAGFYSVTITDAGGCTYIDTLTLGEPDVVTVQPTITPISCAGVCDGGIVAVGQGGTAPYAFTWDDGTTGDTRTNLCAGTYIVTITDANNCTGSDTIDLVDPTPIVPNLTVTQPSCNGVCDGTIVSAPTGGTAPYTWLWNDGSTGSSLTGLCAGTYDVTVTDANGCTITDQAIIVDPSPIVIDTVFVTEPTCGSANGSLEALASGGTGTFTYVWNTVDTINPLTNVSAGLYLLEVIDGNGCVVSTTVPVSDVNPNNLAVSVSTTDASCDGSCTGTALATVTGGTGPFSYSWTNSGLDTNEITGLCVGLQGVTVVDLATGCTVADTASVIAPSTLNIQLTGTDNSLCTSVCDGEAQVTVNSGSGIYTYLWSSGGSSDVETGLCGGMVFVTVTDATSGCIAEDSIMINDLPALVVSNVNVVNASCENSNDGSITSTISGGIAPISFNWVGDNFVATTQDISNLLPGDYIYTFIDAVGCETSDTVTVGATTTLNLNADSVTLCEYADSVWISATATSNATVDYLWTDLNGQIVGDSSSVYVAFYPDSTVYVVSATAGSGCLATDTVLISIENALVVEAGLDRTVIAGETVQLGGAPTSNQPSSTYLWSPSDGLSDPGVANPLATPEVSTTYQVNVTTLTGCAGVDTVRIEVLPGFEYPSGFTPNNDGTNDVWNLDFISDYPDAVVTIFNRWGQQLYQSVGYTDPWDGTFEGEPIPVGTYYFIIELNDETFTEPLSGPITIVR